MVANPWDKFYWNDWEQDPALKLCSLAAQGLWMRLLCICAKAEPKGYLLVAGQPLSPADLVTLVGRPETEIETLMSELSLKGVFSRDRIGRIYSRRMIRDVKRGRKARENGAKGGNPTLSNETETFGSDNLPVILPDKPHKPSSISQYPPQNDLPAEAGVVEFKKYARTKYPEDFERFWEAYPVDRNMPKKPAFRQWQKLSPEQRERAIGAMPGFKRYCAENKSWYRPVYADRFLSQEKFEGYAIEAPPDPEEFERRMKRRNKLLGVSQ